jgi:hypothetical protein
MVPRRVLFVFDEASHLLDPKWEKHIDNNSSGIELDQDADISFFQLRRALTSQFETGLSKIIDNSDINISKFVPPKSSFCSTTRDVPCDQLLPPFYTFPPILDDRQITASYPFHRLANDIMLEVRRWYQRLHQ